MSNVIIDRQKIDILANAISIKSGVPLTMTLDEMVEAVDGISEVAVTVPAGGNYPTFTLDISQESPTVTCDKTYAECRALINQSNFAAVVDVPLADTIHSGQATFYQEGYPYITYEFYRLEDGLPYASVVYYENRIEYWTAQSDKLPTTTQLAHFGTQKGTINRSTSEVYLNIPVGAVLEEKYYTISATPNGTAGTPTATKGTVSNHSVSVTPSVTNTTGYITGSTKTGTAVTISASELVSGTYNITSSGTKDVTNYASASVPAGSVTAPSSISGTAASVSTGTNTLTLTKTVSVTPNVTTAGYISSGTAGNSSVSLTANITTKAAATITPTTTNQTIAAGTYLTGAQTIAGDTDLVGSNILSTANIFGVQGTVVVYNYYTGSSTPSSSLGENGDLYFQTED